LPTVDKTWVFAADNEGLVDEGVSAWTINHDAAGNPGGSIEFGADSLNGTIQEKARRSSTGETWETWGVPTGQVVTDLQVVSWDYRCWSITNVTSYTFKMRVVDSAGATVHSAGELVDLSLTLAMGSWQAGGAGTSRAVDAAEQASTTDVRLEIDGTVVLSTTNVADVGLDNILLRMTYAAGAAGALTVPAEFPPRHFGSF
jgi:hypothetical protein